MVMEYRFGFGGGGQSHLCKEIRFIQVAQMFVYESTDQTRSVALNGHEFRIAELIHQRQCFSEKIDSIRGQYEISEVEMRIPRHYTFPQPPARECFTEGIHCLFSSSQCL